MTTLCTMVKICGITRLEDAQTAVDAGADRLGFIFARKSPRFIEAKQVRRIRSELRGTITTVGVFLNHPVEEVLKIMEESGLDIAQLHGNEPPADLISLHQAGVSVYKVFGVKGAFTPERILEYPHDQFLLDTETDQLQGGTGKTFEWNHALAAKAYGRLILAGGLNPGNVASAVEQVRPFGVDVSSGVEASPGKKDPAKVKSFVQAVRQAEIRLGAHSPVVS